MLKKRDQRGAALLEFALVLPVFVFVLYGLLSYGVALSTKHTVTSAAAEGARNAVGATSDANADSRATSRVTDVLGPISVVGEATPRYALTFSHADCGNGRCITVNVVWDYLHHPTLPSLGFNVVLPTTLSSHAVVEYS